MFRFIFLNDSLLGGEWMGEGHEGNWRDQLGGCCGVRVRGSRREKGEVKRFRGDVLVDWMQG